MSEQALSRRQLLAAAGVSAGAVLLGCSLSSLSVVPTPTPDLSPASPGPNQVSRVILGEGGFPALQLDKNQFPEAPSKILAAVYFPTDTAIPSPTHFNGPLPLAKGPYQFPLIFYGHAIRTAIEPSAGHPLNRDFTTIDTILRHLASYGCVCLAPDLNWISGAATKADWQREAVVFLKYYQLLVSTLNQQVFNNQLRLGSVVMLGHSHRAGSVINAGRGLPLFQGPKPLAYGLIAPETDGDMGTDIANVLVIGGTLDTDQGSSPQSAFMHGATPKTQVIIPGANHYGYTDLVSPDNMAVCNCAGGQINLLDENGTISRDAQQKTAAAFLAAMVRYYALGDASVHDYLTGQRQVEGLSVGGIQIQAQGL